jgi:hypothetical protein
MSSLMDELVDEKEAIRVFPAGAGTYRLIWRLNQPLAKAAVVSYLRRPVHSSRI